MTSSEIQAADWVEEAGVTCVVCPVCAFTFDATHMVPDTTAYSCPACAEIELAKALAEAQEMIAEDRRVWGESEKNWEVARNKWWYDLSTIRAERDEAQEKLKAVPCLETVMTAGPGHLYRVGKHVNEDGPEECAEIGGRCAILKEEK